MNVIKNLISRIEEVRTTNKTPCKSYKTEAAAEKAIEKVTQIVADHFRVDHVNNVNYVVFYVESWGRWTAAIDLNKVLLENRCGGYIGIVSQHGFFSY